MVKKVPETQRAQYYYFKGVDAAEQGEYVKALQYACDSLKIENSAQARLLSASVYLSMRLYERAFTEYVRVLALEKNDAAIYAGILSCLKGLSRLDECRYFFDMALRDCDDTQYFFDAVSPVLFSDAPKSKIKLYDRRDKSDIIAQAQELTFDGEFVRAGRLYAQVDFDDYQYAEAQNALAMIALSKFNSDVALTHCNNALAKEPLNVHALCTKAMILSDLPDTGEQVKEILNQLNKASESDKSIAANPMALYLRIANNDNTLKHLTDAAKEYPYNKNVNTMLAIEYANTGGKKSALDILKRLKIIYPDNAVADYYIKKIQRDERNFVIQADIPLAARKTFRRGFKGLSRQSGAAVQKKLKSDDFYSRLDWFLQDDTADEADAVPVIAFLCGYPVTHAYFTDRLLCPEISSWLKCHILCSLMMNGQRREFAVCDGYYYSEFKYRAPKGFGSASKGLKSAYWLAAAFISFFSARQNSKLMKKFETALVSINGTEPLDVTALAAALSFDTIKREPFNDIERCAELFRCPKTALVRYIKALESGIQEPLPKLS